VGLLADANVAYDGDDPRNDGNGGPDDAGREEFFLYVYHQYY
jgi:hypothetical protein